ncbi:MAG: VTT domain-containing protein [Pseudomonadota bacterium]
MDAASILLPMAPAGIYLAVALPPFVQEDAAVVGAAAASVGGAADTVWLFVSILVGLTASDLWKYWLGRAALTQGWARRFADKPGVQSAGDRVRGRLAASLMAVRFVPGTRIPFYVASGFFKAPFGKFSLWVAVSGAAYIAIAFGLFHALGAAAGETARGWAPAAAILAVVILVGFQLMRARRARQPIKVHSR